MTFDSDSVVVENFLGVDIKFSARSGRFSAWLRGVGEVSGRTVDEVEKVVAEKFKPKRIVEVVQSISDPDGHYFGMSEIKVPEKVNITGFNIDRGRGRGAQKTVEYTVSGGGASAISIRRSLRRWNKEAADEMAALVEERKAADRAFLERAREIARKFEPISAETIFEELNTAPAPERVQVEGERDIVEEATKIAHKRLKVVDSESSGE